VYDQSESIEIDGLPVVKDREYCEILHVSDSAKKFECIKLIAVPNQLSQLNGLCTSDATCVEKYRKELRKLNLL
jgi:hypothetical protein